MKRFVAGILVGLILGVMAGSAIMAVADAGDRSFDHVINRVWDSTLNTLKIQGV